MRNARLIVITVILILLATTASYAGTISEDVTYWFKTTNGTDSIMNPSTDWLRLNDANLLVKVQQTVSDQATTLASLNRLSPDEGTNHPGYLYAYSVTNLGVGDPANLADMGITSFHVDWRTSYYATVSHQTPSGWVVDSSVPGGPTWKWTPVDPGLLPNETAGGFWAVSNVGVDGECTSKIIHLAGLGSTDIYGRTTGPCPEPGSIVSLFAGIAGLGLTVKLRRKK